MNCRFQNWQIENLNSRFQIWNGRFQNWNCRFESEEPDFEAKLADFWVISETELEGFNLDLLLRLCAISQLPLKLQISDATSEI
jgi:hypothetical protein